MLDMFPIKIPRNNWNQFNGVFRNLLRSLMVSDYILPVTVCM